MKLDAQHRDNAAFAWHARGGQGELLDLLSCIQPRSVTNHRKARFGSRHDGGYVMIDDLAGMRGAVAIGVSTNDDWDAAMANAGIVVHQYDHSIEAAPTRHPLLMFHKRRVGALSTPDQATLAETIDAFEPGERPDILLKLDAEGSEWEIFDVASADVLDRLAQIICELHDLHRLGDDAFRTRANRVLRKLARSHQCIHVHGNNHSPLAVIDNVVVPQVVEITLAHRGLYEFGPPAELFPTSLDQPNKASEPDLFLGSFQFR